MSVSKKSVMGKQPPAKPDAPASPAADHSLLQEIGKADAGGPGMTWINLTRQGVEEKMSRYRQQQAATHKGSLWQRLASMFRKSSQRD